MVLFRSSRRRFTLGPNQSGATAIEFALLAPILLAFILGTIDVSAYFFTVSQLNAAVQNTSRQIRTGRIQSPITATNVNDPAGRDTFRNVICTEINKVPVFFRNCRTDLRVDVDPFNTYTSGDYTSPDTAPADGIITDDETSFNSGQPGCPVLITAYYMYHTLVPGLERILAATIPNGHYIMVSSAIRNEPYPTGATNAGMSQCPN